MTHKVLFSMHGNVAILTLNDAARRNVLSRDMVRDFHRALDESRAQGARAIVIDAQGTAFCAGANIEDLRTGWMESADPALDPAVLFRRIDQDPRPVVCAVGGPAVGGGFELTLCSDIVVASEKAWFALPELGHGVIPNTAVATLQRIVGFRRASDIVLTRRRLSPDEAVTLGLVTRIAPTNELLGEALALAGDMVATAPPGAIAAAKANLRAQAGTDWARVLSSPLEVPKSEWQEGLDAFAERRQPDYTRFWESSATQTAPS
jgi:enoyl-CoA hydratase/carnithine racemase